MVWLLVITFGFFLNTLDSFWPLDTFWLLCLVVAAIERVNNVTDTQMCPFHTQKHLFEQMHSNFVIDLGPGQGFPIFFNLVLTPFPPDMKNVPSMPSSSRVFNRPSVAGAVL